MPDIANRTIWVGGLPKDVDDNSLLKAFGRCGRVVETKIRHSQIDTFAFITFEDDRSYDRALKTMDQSRYFGAPIKVNVVITRPGNDIRGGEYEESRPKTKGGGRGRSDSRYRQDDSWKDNGGRSSWRRGRDDDDGYQDPPPRREESKEVRRPMRRGGKGVRKDDVGSGGGRGHYDDRDRESSRKGRGRGYDYDDDGGRWRDDRGNRDRSAEYDRGGGGGRRRLPPPSPSPLPRREDDQLSTSRLWVGGMPKDVTESEISRTFSKHGPVQEIVIRHSDFDTFGFVQYRSPAHALSAIKELNQTERFGGTIKVAPAGGKGDKKGEKKGDKKGDSKGGKKGGGKKGKDDWGRRSRSPRRIQSPSPRGRHGRSPRRRYSRSPPARANQNNSVRYCIKLGNLPVDMEAEELLELGDAYGAVVHHSIWEDPKNDCTAGVIEYGVRDEAIKALNDLNDRRMDGWDKKITAGLQQRDG